MSQSRPDEDPQRKAFAAQLLEALQAAEEASQRPKSSLQLAQQAYKRLQFDFPIVSLEELRALMDAYASGRGYPLTAKLLSVAKESAAGHATAAAAAQGASQQAHTAERIGEADSAAAAAAESYLLLYQQLYAAALVWALETGLSVDASSSDGHTEAASAAAAVALGQLHLSLDTPQDISSSELAAGELAGSMGKGSALADGTAEAAAVSTHHQQTAQWESDSEEYEPLESLPAAPCAAHPPASISQQPVGRALSQADVSAVLQHLARQHLSYHCFSHPSTWQQHRLMQRLTACMALARRHPLFPTSAALQEVAGALLALACDRLAAQPSELERDLPPLLEALLAPSQSSSTAAAAATAAHLGAGLAASLALGAGASLASRVSTLSSRRRLWQEVHDTLLPLAAELLEFRQVALARQARQQAAAAARSAGGCSTSSAGTAAGAVVSVAREDWEGMAAACRLLYFYVLEAPPAAAAGSRLQEAVLKGGLFRALVLLFLQLGALPEAEALRAALLLCCASQPGLLQWAAAVPGFGPALAQPAFQPGGAAALHGALWEVVRQAGDEQLERLLLQGAATPQGVPALHQALQLMSDLHTAARGRRLWLPGVDSALRQLSALLRERYGKAAEAGGVGGSSSGDAGLAASEKQAVNQAASSRAPEADDRVEQGGTEDERKLSTSVEEQAELLAQRRAQQLQPACLRLIKDLLQKQGGAGKSD